MRLATTGTTLCATHSREQARPGTVRARRGRHIACHTRRGSSAAARSTPRGSEMPKSLSKLTLTVLALVSIAAVAAAVASNGPASPRAFDRAADRGDAL